MRTIYTAVACLLSGALAHGRSLRTQAAFKKGIEDKAALSGIPSLIRAIPNRLVFNDKVFTATSETVPFIGAMTENVKHLVSLFPDIHEVEFLDNEGCFKSIVAAHSRDLALHFQDEKIGMYKSDICRLAQLAVHGGYYMDTDLNLMHDIREFLPPQVSFASVISFDDGKDSMFQAFLAAAPRHPIILSAMDKLNEFYAGKNHTLNGILEGGLLGTVVMRLAYEEYMQQSMEYGLQDSAGHEPLVKRVNPPDPIQYFEQVDPFNLYSLLQLDEEHADKFKYAYLFGETQGRFGGDWDLDVNPAFGMTRKDWEQASGNCDKLVVDQGKHKVLGFSHAWGSRSCGPKVGPPVDIRDVEKMWVATGHGHKL